MSALKKSILITGISGSGKSTVSKKINALGYKAYNMDSEPGLFAMIDKQTKKPVVNHDNDNLEKVMGMEWICDKNKLNLIIENEPSLLAFYCGDASNLKDLLSLFNGVILLKPGEAAARERLSTRTNNSFGRTKAVQDWIMSFKNLYENEIEQRGAIIIDADKNIDDVAKEAIEKAKGF